MGEPRYGFAEQELTGTRPDRHAGWNPAQLETFVFPPVQLVPKDEDWHSQVSASLQQTSPSHVASLPPTPWHMQLLRWPVQGRLHAQPPCEGQAVSAQHWAPGSTVVEQRMSFAACREKHVHWPVSCVQYTLLAPPSAPLCGSPPTEVSPPPCDTLPELEDPDVPVPVAVPLQAATRPNARSHRKRIREV